MGAAPAATHSVLVAPPVIGSQTVSAGHVVMNGKTYSSTEEALHDYHGTAGHQAYTYNGVQKMTDAPLPTPVVEAAPPPAVAEEVQQEEAPAAAEPEPEKEKEKKVRAAKPTKKGCC